ncbi:MAG: alpha/beta hydrolase [Dehalococcoidia bacterium]|nr:alpha/beta hydrolase [Dehalococcoidia bacterium]
MPEVKRPDGAIIHYEVFGKGYPLLLIAPGAVNSEIAFWEMGPINPIKQFAGEFMVIAMDQRHAGKSWNAPPTFSYDLTAADQVAVLDHAGVRRAHAWGGCIGVAHVLKLIHDAPSRISAGVGQDPVGLDGTNSIATFMEMFKPALETARRDGMKAVVEAALKNPVFVFNNAAGPFAQRIKEDDTFRVRISAMKPDEYIRLVEAFAKGMWPDNPPYFTVDKAWLPRCPAPLLILPGNDPFHPTGIAHAICQTAPHARCLDVDCRSEQKRAATIKAIGAFLQEHAKQPSRA